MSLNRNELVTALRGRIEHSSIWPHIQWGATDKECRNFCRQLYDDFNKPSNKIEGLSLAIVSNQLPNVDHVWIVAHHPDVGYLMVDPTIGQFVTHTKTDKPYSDVFIGTYRELEGILSGGDYKLRGSASRLHDKGVHVVWSPAIKLCPYEKANETYFCSTFTPKMLKGYEFQIDMPRDLQEAESHGLWAARMEEAGVNWLNILRDVTGLKNFPEPSHPGQMKVYKDICEARNRYIELGEYGCGTSYRELLGEEYKSHNKSDKTR